MSLVTLTPPAYRGRFAPTPSGPLHFGSLVAALASWLDARQQGGEWWLRIDDIDPPREAPGAATRICQQLEAHGLHWDKKLHQSTRHDRYQAAIDQLLAQGQAFYCRLSRQQLVDYPQHPGISVAVAAASDTAIRLAVSSGNRRYQDLLLPDYQADLQALGGAFVIRRRDGLFAYHLACAIDDASLGMTHILRGADLRDATPQQQWIMQCLSLPLPAYGHLPLIVDGADKLSKSSGSASLRDDQAAAQLLRALTALGQQPPSQLQGAGVADILDWGVAHWSRARLPSGAIDIHRV